MNEILEAIKEEVKDLAGFLIFMNIFTVILAVHKMFGDIPSSWWWVLVPTFLSIGIPILVYIISTIVNYIDDIDYRNRGR